MSAEITRMLKEMEVKGIKEKPLDYKTLKRIKEDIEIAATSGGSGGSGSGGSGGTTYPDIFADGVKKTTVVADSSSPVEGGSIPDGASDSYTKTFTFSGLSGPVSKAIVTFAGQGGYISHLPYLSPFGLNHSFFVTDNYLEGVRLSSGTDKTKNFGITSNDMNVPYIDFNALHSGYSSEITYANTYSGKSYIEAMYFDGADLIVKLKKCAATSGATLSIAPYLLPVIIVIE